MAGHLILTQILSAAEHLHFLARGSRWNPLLF